VLTFVIRLGSDRMPDGITTSYAISVYHHWCCEFDFWLWRGKLDTILCNTVYQWLPPPIKLTVTI